MPKPTSIFKSRTAIVALLTTLAGAMGSASEPVAAFLRDHAPLILLIIGPLNFVLRRVTHGSVTLIPDRDDDSLP